MSQIANIVCPSCNAPLKFSNKANKLVCEYCGSSFAVSEIEDLYKEKIVEAQKETQENEEENKEKWNYTGIHSFTCSSCNAEIICEKNTVATSCPYCGNPSIIPGQYTDNVIPELIIPFKVSKNEAVESLKKFYEKKRFLPKSFKELNHIEEIKGVYVPFWLYDVKTNSNIVCEATNVSEHRTSKEIVTKTSFYRVERGGDVTFSKIPVDASVNMDNAQMDSIEPYDYSEFEPFSVPYLSGYLAESYDDNLDDCEKRMKIRAENTCIEVLYSTIKSYDTCSIQSKESFTKVLDKKYAFLPVWILNTNWNGKNFRFAINGQTGKLVGNLPIEKKKVAKYLIGITFLGTIVFSSIFYFLFNVV